MLPASPQSQNYLTQSKSAFIQLRATEGRALVHGNVLWEDYKEKKEGMIRKDSRLCYCTTMMLSCTVDMKGIRFPLWLDF